jgi:hypothetical protein
MYDGLLCDVLSTILSLKVKTYGTTTFTMTILQDKVLFFILQSGDGCPWHKQA